MEPSRRAPGYDLFKSIVAILLLILFFLLNTRVPAQSPTPISTLVSDPLSSPQGATTPAQREGASPLRASSTTIPASATSLSLISTSSPLTSPTATQAAVATQASFPSPTRTMASALTVTPLSEPTQTSATIPTQTPLASPTVINVPEPTATPLPSPTATPATSSTSTPIAGTPLASACESSSSRSRLQNGMNATILRRLNFRSSPGIRDNWLRTNLPGTNVQVIGGPQCVPHFTGAYVWWQIKLPDGQTGWSAEGSQFGSFYFMEPSQQ